MCTGQLLARRRDAWVICLGHNDTLSPYPIYSPDRIAYSASSRLFFDLRFLCLKEDSQKPQRSATTID